MSAFRSCGLIGISLACVLAAGLAHHSGLSLGIVAALAANGVLTFLIVAMITKIVTGSESLTYYHHQNAALLTSALVLRWRGVPLLPYLDLAILGIGVFLACGRVGCLLAGCCHGIPCRWGVRYGRRRVAGGFPPHLAGIRLVPLQAIESVWVLGIVVAGSLLVLTEHAPGAALSCYISLYALGRFAIEFLRGDAERPYLLGFSEAQWTSFGLLCAVVWAGWRGMIPSWPWQALAAVVMLLAAMALRLHPKLRRLHLLLHPSHLREFAEALELVAHLSAEEDHARVERSAIHLAATALGIQVSCGRAPAARPSGWHFTLSQSGTAMTSHTAHILAKLVPPLIASPERARVIAGRGGTFHLMPKDGHG